MQPASETCVPVLKRTCLPVPSKQEWRHVAVTGTYTFAARHRLTDMIGLVNIIVTVPSNYSEYCTINVQISVLCFMLSFASASQCNTETESAHSKDFTCGLLQLCFRRICYTHLIRWVIVIVQFNPRCIMGKSIACFRNVHLLFVCEAVCFYVAIKNFV